MTTVAVVIPAYNSAPFLARAVESALGQSVPPDEIIVVDDGSTDATAEVAAGFTQVTLLRQENKGLSAARNSGIRAANSDFVAFLDADDWWAPQHVANIREAASQGARWTASAWVRTDGANRVEVRPFAEPGPRHYLHVAAYRNVMVPSGVAVERQLLLEVGCFPEEIRRHAEDKITWGKLAALCPEVTFLSEPTLNYYQHPGSITKAKIPAAERVATGLDRAQRLLDILKANPAPEARRMERGTALRAAASLLRFGAPIPSAPFRQVLQPLNPILRHGLLLAGRFPPSGTLVSRGVKIMIGLHR